MLDLIELRKNELEFSDSFISEQRKKFDFLSKTLFKGGTLLIFILFILTITNLISPLNNITPIFIFLILLPITLFIGRHFLVLSKLKVDLQGCVIQFDLERNISAVSVQMWKNGKLSEYSQEFIRYNQSVGFKAVIDNTGLISVVIIVHKDYPGDVIFQTYDIDTLAEFKNCLNIIFPKYEEWYNFTEDGSDWDEEETLEFEEVLSFQKVPLLLRDYFPI